MSLLDKLRELGISENLIKEIERFRSQYPVDREYESRIPVPTQFYYGSDVWEQAITAVLCGENLLSRRKGHRKESFRRKSGRCI